ncbi:hypothetical protein R1sor_003651 [Riccia sorocarpa]|uniref:Uncharacterized protein n=1 Tax=Riccia sorocarpa TaxID=122646 RepID=A0ABD3H646_9MARC
MADRRGSCWSDLDRRRSYAEKRKSLARKAPWVERKSLWESTVEDATTTELMFMTLVDDLENRVSKNQPGILQTLFKCLQCSMTLKSSGEKQNPLMNHLYRTLLPQLIGYVYMNEPSCNWYEPPDILDADETLIRVLVMVQDLLSAELKYLVEPTAEDRFTNAIALLRVATMGSDKTTYFHRTHKHRPIPQKELLPYGSHHFTGCVAGDDGTDRCISCGKTGASRTYRWIAVLVENFGQVNWTNFEFLAKVLENPRNQRVLPLDVTEAILCYISKIIEFLDPDLAKSFLLGALVVMELLVQRDEPVDPEKGIRPSDRFISVAFMIDKHLDAIIGYVLTPEAREWLMKHTRSCKYRNLLGYKPLKLCMESGVKVLQRQMLTSFKQMLGKLGPEEPVIHNEKYSSIAGAP